jgi:hypothetical protein
MLHIFKTLTIDEMTSSRWNEFNDMEHICKKIHTIFIMERLSCGMCNIVSFLS